MIAPTEELYAGDGMAFEFLFKNDMNYKAQYDITFHLRDEMDNLVFEGSTAFFEKKITKTGSGYYRAYCQIPAKLLNEGNYRIGRLFFIKDGVIKENIGDDYLKYTTYLLTVFFFILINNLMGLIPIFPFGANVSGNIAFTMVLALSAFVVVSVAGTKHYWKEIYWPDTPLFLKFPIPIMPFVEIFGVFTKPFSLMIRLFANIMAGHTIILGLTCLIFVTVSLGVVVHSGMTVFSVLLTVFMNFIELLVACIQAYIFTMLAAVYIGQARVRH